ncbi:hypothetical protein EOL29_20035, partial [Citrobacter freundii]|uniref:hypothetical protein n=1 Tax=Citrobacter freundii TaxID=546 RepID=UPI000FE0D7E3
MSNLIAQVGQLPLVLKRFFLVRQQQFNQLVESGATAAEKRASAEKKLSQLIEKNRQDAKD